MHHIHLPKNSGGKPFQAPSYTYVHSTYTRLTLLIYMREDFTRDQISKINIFALLSI